VLHPGQDVNCRPAEGQSEIELYGLQRTRHQTPPQISSYCLVNVDQQAEATVRQWLVERFSPTPPQPLVGEANATDDPTQFLTSLAAATHCSFKAPQGDAGNVEVDLYVYAMRDFADTGCGSCANPGADYYLVQDNVTYSDSSQPITYGIEAQPPIEASSGQPLRSGLLGLEFADPATTTTYESSYSNGSSVTVSDSVGIGADGPNVTSGAEVTTSNETTYSVPPTRIVNQSNLTTGQAKWSFTPQSLPHDAVFEVAPTWTWYIPREAYPSGGTGNGQIRLSHVAGLEDEEGGPIFGQPGPFCNVPYPFSDWTVNPPALTNLEPASTVINGGQFTITGQYLYPGSVVAVLIGGTAIPLTTNVDLAGDTTIHVVVPRGYAPGTYKVQVNTEFNSETRFSNTLNLTLTN
jgi:hypothetical protein